MVDIDDALRRRAVPPVQSSSHDAEHVGLYVIGGDKDHLDHKPGVPRSLGLLDRDSRPERGFHSKARPLRRTRVDELLALLLRLGSYPARDGKVRASIQRRAAVIDIERGDSKLLDPE